MSEYNAFAEVYDRLTGNIEYSKRAEFIRTLLNRHGVSDGAIVLDLACGTGSLTAELAKHGYDMIGVDNSPMMLCEAQNKMYDSGINMLFLCQSMTELDLFGTIDAAVCTLDSLKPPLLCMYKISTAGATITRPLLIFYPLYSLYFKSASKIAAHVSVGTS